MRSSEGPLSDWIKSSRAACHRRPGRCFDELCKPEEDSQLGVAEFSQPCCTALQIALVDVLNSWGISPNKVVGHSSGEIAGAYASGAISADDAIRIAYYRGLSGKELVTMKDSGLDGGMAAVGLGRQDVSPLLRPGVMIACENSPESITLSGDLTALLAVMESIKAKYPDVLVRQLRVDCAYHSHHMKRVSPKLYRHARKHQVPLPSCPILLLGHGGFARRLDSTGCRILGKKPDLAGAFLAGCF